ncbi:hypothetical protein QTJ16_005747 [Diplocarpon rosae]|uniref:Protein kinase domain-containing protein n=1 Tax=Diplocarpon rosae TaxID=946125 RepID=A0AAD9SYB1_9HELO|nr:hypothetical protein QTJ16_005747 [Diplocarpon rosae]
MIESGLEFSKVSTGVADVFLRLQEDEPHTLYYHLAEPTIEAEVQDEAQSEAQLEASISLSRTAVSQTLTFCLMALDSKPRSQEWRNRALETSSKAVIDFEEVLRQIPEEDKALTPPSSVYQARSSSFVRSPIKLRPRKPQQARNSCRSAEATLDEDPQGSSGTFDEPSDVDTPSKPKAHVRRSDPRQMQSIESSDVLEESSSRHQQYCTHACLSGLVRNRPLDEACPNFNSHCTYGDGICHTLDQKSLAEHMTLQLAENPENGCEPLGLQGARGALFKLHLKLHGYTFVAKGTVMAFEAQLKHEGSVYQYLDEVQGELIPVYLGNISLVRPYFLDIGVRIIHMLLMSWGGEQAQKDTMLAIGQDLNAETIKAITKIRSYGVEHHDVRSANVLWSAETRNVMLIDFERSEILKRLSVLQETSPNRQQKTIRSDVKVSGWSISDGTLASPGKSFE